MLRAVISCLCGLGTLLPVAAGNDTLRGTYVEARTCQVYTGPCFASGEVGLSGKNAIMTWRITDGKIGEIDLSGLSAALVLKASETLGFNGLADAKQTRAVLLIDARASQSQGEAMQNFVLRQTGLTAENLVGNQRADMSVELDLGDLTARVDIENIAHLRTRKARKGDCICSNESAYYPPLAELNGFVPGVTIDGEVKARKLGTRWSIPDSRSAYMGTFEFDFPATVLANKS